MHKGGECVKRCTPFGPRCKEGLTMQPKDLTKRPSVKRSISTWRHCVTTLGRPVTTAAARYSNVPFISLSCHSTPGKMAMIDDRRSSHKRRTIDFRSKQFPSRHAGEGLSVMLTWPVRTTAREPASPVSRQYRSLYRTHHSWDCLQAEHNSDHRVDFLSAIKRL